MRERAQHSLFETVYVFLDVVARALQVDERIGHHLPRAVEGHLPAAVGRDHGDVPWRQNVLVFARQPLRIHRFMLAYQKHIGALRRACGGVVLHGLHGGRVVHPAQHVQLER